MWTNIVNSRGIFFFPHFTIISRSNAAAIAGSVVDANLESIALVRLFARVPRSDDEDSTKVATDRGNILRDVTHMASPRQQ